MFRRGLSRRRTGDSGSGFIPTQLGGLVLWLRADLGITITNPVVASPNDVSTASWNKVSSTTPNASTIQDTADGAPTEHYVWQAVSGVQSSKSATLIFEAKAGTLGFVRALLGGANAAYVNLTTGAVGQVDGATTVSVTALADGWFRIAVTAAPTGANSFIETAVTSATGGNVYTGAGTGTIQVRAVDVKQNNVSAWADQSSAGNHTTQGTGGNQPLLVALGMAGRPVVDFDHANDQLQAATAATWKFLHDGTGCTVFFVDGAVTNDTQSLLRTVIGTVGFDIFRATSGGSTVYNGRAFVAGAPIFSTATAAKTIAPHVISFSYLEGGSPEARLWVDGTLSGSSDSSGPPSAANPDAALVISGVPGTPTTTPTDDAIPEIIIYNRDLTVAERQVAERALGARYGIAVA